MNVKTDIDYIQFIVIDLFCGLGGTTLGFEEAETNYHSMYAYLKSIGIDPPKDKKAFLKVSKVVACVNHDHLAIKSHWCNHPEIEHFEEDIRILDPFGRLQRLIEIYRAFYPHAKIILWASLECTNFSKAKGGEARDADSRTLANHLYNYIHALDPDYVFIENVVEFMAWGPMIPKIIKSKEGYQSCLLKIKKKDNQIFVSPGLVPESRNNGKDWMKWRQEINSFGYHDAWKQINCADYGALTSRNRLFGCFAKEGLPIVWPAPTHSKKPVITQTMEPLTKWQPVKTVLDFDDEGKSIFNRTKKDGTPDYLSPNTMQRLFMGAVKHIAGGKDNFLTQSSKGWSKFYSSDLPSLVITKKDNQHLIKACFIDQRNGGDQESKSKSIEEPSKTLTATGGNQQLVQAHFIAKHYSGKPEDKSSSIEDPLSTITTKDHNAIVKASFITKWNSNNKETGGHHGHSIDEPSPVISTQNRLGIVQTHFISKYNSVNGGKHHNSDSIDGPVGAIMTKDSHAKVSAELFLNKAFTSGGNHQSIDDPAGTIMPNDKHSLIKAEKFIMDTSFKNVGTSIEDPAPTIVASRRHHYIVNPSWYGNSGSIDEPCYVVIARQDKAPLYLITCDEGPLQIPVYDDDCEWTIKLKEFMALYNICDIKMRMLKVIELKLIQGFPADYIILGNQTNQKKFIGNAVHHIVPKKWIEAFSTRIIKHNEETYKIAA